MAINESTGGNNNGIFLTMVPVLGGVIRDTDETRAALEEVRAATKCPQTEAFSKEAGSISQQIIKLLADRKDAEGNPAPIKTIANVTGQLRSITYREKVIEERNATLRTAYIVVRDGAEIFTIKANMGHESGQKLIEKIKDVPLNAEVQLSMFGTYGANPKEPNGKKYTNYAASVKVKGADGKYEEVKVDASAYVGLNEKIAALKAMNLSKETVSTETRAIKAKHYAEVAQAAEAKIQAARAAEAPTESHAAENRVVDQAAQQSAQQTGKSFDNFDDDIPF